MNLKFIKYSGSSLILFFLLTGCFQSDYTRIVKSELAKGIRMDSILFGIKFSDTRDAFYGKCFDLNKTHLVTQGPSGNTVQYLFVDSLLHDKPTELRLLFYPTFDKKNKISEMKMEFSYSSWAPWNEQYHAKQLVPKVKELLTLWYAGNSFVEAKVKGDLIPVKVDGNRRIIVTEKDVQSVSVKVQDILHPMFKHTDQ
jgi:hypothetical protein